VGNKSKYLNLFLFLCLPPFYICFGCVLSSNFEIDVSDFSGPDHHQFKYTAALYLQPWKHDCQLKAEMAWASLAPQRRGRLAEHVKETKESFRNLSILILTCG